MKDDNSEINTMIEDIQKMKFKNDKELQETILKFLSTPKQKASQSLTEKQIIYLSTIQTLIDYKTREIRDKLMEIRSQMDVPRSNMIVQTKQQLTNLIKGLK